MCGSPGPTEQRGGRPLTASADVPDARARLGPYPRHQRQDDQREIKDRIGRPEAGVTGDDLATTGAKAAGSPPRRRPRRRLPARSNAGGPDQRHRSERRFDRQQGNRPTPHRPSGDSGHRPHVGISCDQGAGRARPAETQRHHRPCPRRRAETPDGPCSDAERDRPPEGQRQDEEGHEKRQGRGGMDERIERQRPRPRELRRGVWVPVSRKRRAAGR